MAGRVVYRRAGWIFDGSGGAFMAAQARITRRHAPPVRVRPPVSQQCIGPRARAFNGTDAQDGAGCVRGGVAQAQQPCHAPYMTGN
jgi:hypothetical protein